MDIIQSIKEKNRANAAILTTIPKTKISKRLKFFINEILELNTFFPKTQQAEILSESLGVEITYPAYNSFFNRNIKPLLNQKGFK